MNSELQKSVKQNAQVILFVPGINAKKQKQLFEILREEASKVNIDTEYLDMWNSGSDLNEMCIEDITKHIHQATSSLAQKGYKHIYGVGKSFGGGMLLAARDQVLQEMVLWAPAIGFSEAKESFVQKHSTKLFSEIDSLMSITLTSDFLQSISIPVHILHGNEDEVIPVENSIATVSALPNAQFHLITNMSHSPREGRETYDLIQSTISLLKY